MQLTISIGSGAFASINSELEARKMMKSFLKDSGEGKIADFWTKVIEAAQPDGQHYIASFALDDVEYKRARSDAFVFMLAHSGESTELVRCFAFVSRQIDKRTDPDKAEARIFLKGDAAPENQQA